MAYAQMRTPLLASSLGERIREPLTVAIKIGLPTRSRPFLLAQEEGFEPPCLLGKRFSRPPRCDRFDIPAYHNARCRIMISRESLCGSGKFIFQNPLRIPHAAVSSSLASGKCGYLRQSRNIPITMQNCAIIQY